jgi:hypothetical protein
MCDWVMLGDAFSECYFPMLIFTFSFQNMNDPLCDIVENMCFIPKQTLYLDNCWFLVSKSDLDSSTASVQVTAYNQALLSRSTVFDVS